MALSTVLDHARWHPFKTKGDFARKHANLVALAASDGLITTRVATGLYGSSWSITVAGLKRLEMLRGMLAC